RLVVVDVVDCCGLLWIVVTRPGLRYSSLLGGLAQACIKALNTNVAPRKELCRRRDIRSPKTGKSNEGRKNVAIEHLDVPAICRQSGPHGFYGLGDRGRIRTRS